MRTSDHDLGPADVATLVARYREAAVLHMAASAEGGPATANQQYDAIMEINQELRSRGAEAQQALLLHPSHEPHHTFGG